MDSSDDGILYKSAKYQTATVEIVTPDYNFDLYSPSAQGTKVELYKGNDLEWTGYVTPNLYDMGFEKSIENIQVECIDALSTLQYYKYKQSDKQVRSFWYIINKILSKTNAYKYFYVSDNTQLTAKSDSCILEGIYISESNFFDKKEKDETDDDVAWTCQEVLEEICQYLGLTVVAEKYNVYFLDYDAIKSGNNTYWKYAVDGNSTGSKVTLSNSKTIQSTDYSANGSTISLSNVYNKVTIKSELYDYDKVLPDPFDKAVNIVKDSDPTLQSAENTENGMYGEVIASGNDKMEVLIDRIWHPQKHKYGAFNLVALKYYNSPNYKFYKYDRTGNDITNSVSSLNFTDTKSMYGATLARFSVKELNRVFKANYFDPILHQGISLDTWLQVNELSDFNFEEYIMLLNPNGSLSNDNIESYPFFETTMSDSSALFGGKNAYLIISGSYNFHYFNDDPYPIPQGEVDISEGRYAINAGQTYLLCKLEWGGQYWNGDEWTTTSTTFKLPYMAFEENDDKRRADQTMFKDNNFINTVSWRIGTDKKGYVIKTPSEHSISGQPKLTVYKPFDPTYKSTKSDKQKGQYYKHSVVFLKNFKLTAFIGDPTFSNDQDTDTKYTMDIDSDYT